MRIDSSCISNNKYSELTKLSYNYLREQQRTPPWYEMFYRNFDLTTKTGRYDFKLYWKIYREWTIKHSHWYLIATLKGVMKLKRERNQK